MLKAFFDESGHSADSRCDFVGIGGIVAPSDKWEIFEHKWKDLLDEYDLDYFHTVDFAHSVKHFSKWKDKNKEAERREFLAKMFSVIEETGGKPFGSVVYMKPYRALEMFLQPAVNPYYLCFQDCVKAAAILCTFEPPEAKVEMVFEEQMEFAGFAEKFYQAMKNRKAEGYERMGTFEMASKKEVLPLQAADFIAYEMRHYCSNLKLRPKDKMRWGMEQIERISLKNHGFLWLDLHTSEKLLQTAANYREIEKRLLEMGHEGNILTSLNALNRKENSDKK